MRHRFVILVRSKSSSSSVLHFPPPCAQSVPKTKMAWKDAEAAAPSTAAESVAAAAAAAVVVVGGGGHDDGAALSVGHLDFYCNFHDLRCSVPKRLRRCKENFEDE